MFEKFQPSLGCTGGSRWVVNGPGLPIPAMLDHVVLTCLAKKPEKRPQNARQVAVRLIPGDLGEDAAPPNIVRSPAENRTRINALTA